MPLYAAAWGRWELLQHLLREVQHVDRLSSDQWVSTVTCKARLHYSGASYNNNCVANSLDLMLYLQCYASTAVLLSLLDSLQGQDLMIVAARYGQAGVVNMLIKDQCWSVDRRDAQV